MIEEVAWGYPESREDDTYDKGNQHKADEDTERVATKQRIAIHSVSLRSDL